MRSVILGLGFLVAFAQSTVALADPCQPYARLLKNPYIERVGKCIFSLKLTSSTGERRAFAEKLVVRALTDADHENKYPGSQLSYYDLAELVAILDSSRMVDAVLDFIARHGGSADETRAFAVARLYELRAPLVLDRIAARPEADQKTITSSIAWGVANNFHPFANLTNYHRLAVGAHWEILEPAHPNRAISKSIEDQLRRILDRQK